MLLVAARSIDRSPMIAITTFWIERRCRSALTNGAASLRPLVPVIQTIGSSARKRTAGLGVIASATRPHFGRLHN